MTDLSWMRPKLAELCGLKPMPLHGMWIDAVGRLHDDAKWRPDEDVAQAIRCLDAQPHDWLIDPRWVVIEVPVEQDDGPMYYEPKRFKSETYVDDEPLGAWIARNVCLAIAAALGWEKPQETGRLGLEGEG